MTDYSTKKISRELLKEVKSAMRNIRGWGSVEIYIQDYRVTQITERTIKKTYDIIKADSKNKRSIFQ